MLPPSTLRQLTALAAASSVFSSSSLALVRWDDSKNQIFVTAAGTLTYDSNIYTASGGDGDMITSGQVGLEYERRAGLIGVNASIGVTVAYFADNSDENFQNPSARLELVKDSGRTTGSVTTAVQRESRAEPAANFRTDAWNYETGGQFKYPVIDRYSISGGVKYWYRDYTGNPLLVDLTTYEANSDLLYAYTSERDLLAGYRFRVSETSADSTYEDHAVTFGVSGRILPKLNGSLRFGYQYRFGKGPSAEDDSSFTAAGSATWRINRRASLTGQISQDFGTTSTNVSINSLAASLDGQYAFTAHFTAGAGVGAGRNTFLGGLGNGREDVYTSAHLDAGYTFSEYLRLSVTYGFYHNWSTLAVSDFERHTFTFSASSRF
jgi:hypothetical protein